MKNLKKIVVRWLVLDDDANQTESDFSWKLRSNVTADHFSVLLCGMSVFAYVCLCVYLSDSYGYFVGNSTTHSAEWKWSPATTTSTKTEKSRKKSVYRLFAFAFSTRKAIFRPMPTDRQFLYFDLMSERITHTRHIHHILYTMSVLCQALVYIHPFTRHIREVKKKWRKTSMSEKIRK